jgi:hypothetical protein
MLSGTGMELFFYPHAGTGNPTGKILRVRVRVSTTRRVRTRCHLESRVRKLETQNSGSKGKKGNTTKNAHRPFRGLARAHHPWNHVEEGDYGRVPR